MGALLFAAVSVLFLALASAAGYQEAIESPSFLLDAGVEASAAGNVPPPGFAYLDGVPTLTIPAKACSIATGAGDTCHMREGMAVYSRQPINLGQMPNA